MTDDLAWKTEEYHAHAMHVQTRHRPAENPGLPGHGAQWDFTVKVTPVDAGPTWANAEIANSDPGIFYSTQAIAENMGFLKGREIVEGRVARGAGENEYGSRTL